MSKAAIQKRRRTYTKQFYRGNSFAFLITVFVTILLVCGNLMISWLCQVLVDISTGADVGFTLVEVMLLCIGCVGVFILGMGLSYVTKPRFIARAIGQYREHVFEKLAQKGISAFSGENTSFYISALSNDANTIETDYLSNIFLLIDDILLFFGSFALMLWYSPLLTAMAVILALLPVVASLLAGNRVARAEKLVSDKNEAYTSTLTDSLSGFAVVKAFRAEAAMCRLFGQRVREVTEAKTLRRKTLIIVQSMGLIAGLIAQLGVFVAGAAMALNGQAISAGTLIAFVNLMNFVVNPIGTVPQYLAQRKAACALIDKLADALDENVREEGKKHKADLSNGIHVEDLSFGYEEGKPVLQHVNYTFGAGKSYAIVGASGCGKSTLLNLLMAAHSNYEGAIRYDETDLKDIQSESLYDMVSIVQQNVFIFNASIRDNITMFTAFPAKEVERAIHLSGLSDLIRERGEDYLCGENGSGLSGGEKQRISIARSLLKKSQVLLVDEATAALDHRTAHQVTSAILGLQGLTRIVVTHALEANLLKQFDCVLTLKNGCIAEEGSFDELMDKKGYFYSLYMVSQ